MEKTHDMLLYCAGVLRVNGLMPPRCRMFDTPGVPHSHQLASVLTAEEVLHNQTCAQYRLHSNLTCPQQLVGCCTCIASWLLGCFDAALTGQTAFACLCSPTTGLIKLPVTMLPSNCRACV